MAVSGAILLVLFLSGQGVLAEEVEDKAQVDKQVSNKEEQGASKPSAPAAESYSAQLRPRVSRRHAKVHGQKKSGTQVG